MLSVEYDIDGFVPRKIECIDFVMVDHENGELADAPPNGHASPTALRRAPPLIGKCIHELQGGFDLQVVALMCGQGLTEHVDLLDKSLKEGLEAPEFPHPPIEGVLVYASSSTGASEAAGVRPVFGDPNAMAAMLARLGL